MTPKRAPEQRCPNCGGAPPWWGTKELQTGTDEGKKNRELCGGVRVGGRPISKLPWVGVRESEQIYQPQSRGCQTFHPTTPEITVSCFADRGSSTVPVQRPVAVAIEYF